MGGRFVGDFYGVYSGVSSPCVLLIVILCLDYSIVAVAFDDLYVNIKYIQHIAWCIYKVKWYVFYYILLNNSVSIPKVNLYYCKCVLLSLYKCVL